MSILDWFRPPVIIEGNARYNPTPYRAHCPERDWTSHRWWADTKSPREEHAWHWVQNHYEFDSDAWFSGYSDGFYY